MLPTQSTITRSIVSGAIVGSLAFASTAWGQAAPRSFVASPEVYKIVTQDNQYMVIEATWAPGQRDKPHSHPHHARYFLNSCNLRATLSDGSHSDLYMSAGGAVVRGSIEVVSLENIGSTACKMIFFEPK